MSWIFHQFKQTAAKKAIFYSLYAFLNLQAGRSDIDKQSQFHIMRIRSKQNAYREHFDKTYKITSNIHLFTSFSPHDLDSDWLNVGLIQRVA